MLLSVRPRPADCDEAAQEAALRAAPEGPLPEGVSEQEIRPGLQIQSSSRRVGAVSAAGAEAVRVVLLFALASVWLDHRGRTPLCLIVVPAARHGVFACRQAGNHESER